MTSITDVKGSAPPSLDGDDGLFVRKSSGLVREIGLRDAVSVATGGVSPFINIVVIYVVLAFASNADLSLPLIIGAILLIPLALTYAQLVAAFPRSGGDYVYAGRVIHPIVGSFVGFAMLLLYLYLAAGTAVLVGQELVPQFLQTVGAAASVHALSTFGNTVANDHWWQFAITAAVVALAGVFVARGGRAVGRSVWWLFIAGVVGVALLTINALAHSTGAFRVAYDHATLASAYRHVISAAHSAGIATGSTWSGFTLALPYMALFYVGFQMNNVPAGELKRPSKTYMRATVLCLTATGALMLVAWLALKHLTGLTFIQSASGLSQGSPAAWAHVTGGAPFTATYYAEILGSPVIRILIAGAFVLGGLINPIAVSFVASRVMFALSFDRLLPNSLAEVRERSHMPVNAALVATAVVLLFGALTIFSTGFTHAARNALLMTLFLFLVASLSCAILPFRRRELYEGSPKAVPGRIGRIPMATVVAVVSFAIAGWLFYVAATHNALSGGYDAGSVATLIGVGVAGIIAYGVSRAYMRRVKGVDIELAMRELPPE